MSQASNTQYQIYIQGNINSGTINLYSDQDGWTDADALALQAVLATWVPPSGTSFQVLKVTTTTDTATAGGSPAAFS